MVAERGSAVNYADQIHGETVGARRPWQRRPESSWWIAEDIKMPGFSGGDEDWPSWSIKAH
eukprot:1896762-Pyramimonas_sp.AAC.2